MTPEFWAGKRVLVTGHTGFKGSWLSLWLKMLGAHVSGYAFAAPDRPNLYSIAQLSNDMTSCEGDIRDLKNFSSFIQQQQPEVVLHLAAQALVGHSYDDPVATYSTNVMGTVNVLEAVRQCPSVKAVIVVTSDKCYENREWYWGYRENEPLGGYDPYSSSKACAELVTSSYRNCFFAPQSSSSAAVASVRAGNVIGGGDWAEGRLIPDVIQSFMANFPVVLRAPRALRPWQHVLEPLGGYLLLAERLCCDGQDFAQAWNFGPDDQDVRSVDSVVETLGRFWGVENPWQPAQNTTYHEAQVLRLDCTKARHSLGWHARLHLDQALEWTVAWFKAYRDGQDMRQLTQSQIYHYQEMLS